MYFGLSTLYTFDYINDKSNVVRAISQWNSTILNFTDHIFANQKLIKDTIDSRETSYPQLQLKVRFLFKIVIVVILPKQIE